jgi:hypothetical protein
VCVCGMSPLGHNLIGFTVVVTAPPGGGARGYDGSLHRTADSPPGLRGLHADGRALRHPAPARGSGAPGGLLVRAGSVSAAGHHARQNCPAGDG